MRFAERVRSNRDKNREYGLNGLIAEAAQGFDTCCAAAREIVEIGRSDASGIGASLAPSRESAPFWRSTTFAVQTNSRSI
jgi:hypothetical protein